jgi:hypothetical protein
MVSLEDAKNIYWFRQNVSSPVCGSLRYQLCIRFAVGVINDRERVGCPKSLVSVKRALKAALLA